MGAIIADSANQAPGRVSIAVWLGFAAMCLGMFMGVLDVQIVATSLPRLQEALSIPPDWMSWIQTSYLIAEVIAIPLTGLFTRVLSMRGIFVAAIVVFTISSIGCAFSFGFADLLMWRIIQGFAGGMLIPIVFAAVFLLFPFRTQGIATTIAGVLAVLAPTVGPIVGGWVTETFSWRWLFLINVAPGIAAALIAMFLLPREKADVRYLRRLDMIALPMLALALAALEIGLKEAPHRGWSSGLVVGLFALAIASGTGFVLRTLRRDPPVVHLRLLADRDFTLGCMLSFATGAGLYGSVYLMPVFLAFVRGHGPLEIGEVMLVTGAAQLLASPLAVALERRTDARVLVACGLAFFAIGLGMSAWQTRNSDFNEMFWPQVVRGGALMFCLLPTIRLAVGHLPLDRVPDASGLFNLTRNLGGAIGLALIDTVIYGRAPGYGQELGARLLAGDASAAAIVGLPTALFNGQPMAIPDAATVQMVQGLIEKAALVHAVNDAWFMLALIMGASLVLVPFVRHKGVPVALAVH